MEGGGGKGLASSYITSFSAKGAKCNLLRRNTPFSLVEEEKYRKMNGEKVKKWFFEVTQINNQKSLSLLFRYRRNRFIVEGELNPEIQLNQRTRFTKIRIAIQVSRDDPTRVEEIHNEYDLDRVTPTLPITTRWVCQATRINWHGFARLSISRPPVSTQARFCAVKLFARTPENDQASHYIPLQRILRTFVLGAEACATGVKDRRATSRITGEETMHWPGADKPYSDPPFLLTLMKNSLNREPFQTCI